MQIYYSKTGEVVKKLLILPLLLIILSVGAILAFNGGVFHKQIEDKVAALTGARVQLGATSLLTFPLRLEIGSSLIEHSVAHLEWESLVVQLDSLLPPLDVRVTLSHPKVRMLTSLANASSAPANSAAPQPAAGGGPREIPAWRLSVRVDDGEFYSKEVQLKALTLNFSQKLLMRSPAAVQLKTLVTTNVIPASLPFTIETDSLTFNEEAVKTQGLKATVAGLSAELQGTSLLKEGRHRWLLEIKAPDLSKLPQPPAVVPAKNWKGGIQISAELNKASPQAPWSAEGIVNAAGVSADLAMHQGGVTADGIFSLDLKSKFLYMNNAASIPELTGQLDLTAAKILYEDVFVKATAVPLKVKIEALGDQKSLTVKSLDLTVWDIKAHVTGSMGTQAPWTSALKFNVPAVGLAGLEKILVPLRKAPVKGELALQADIKGPLADPVKCHIVIESLRLKGFSAGFDYTKTGTFAARGQVVADVSGTGELDNGEVKSAKGQGSINLRDAALVLGPLRKEAGKEFAADFSLSNSGQNLSIDRFELRSFFGKISTRGTVVNPLKPKVNLAVTALPLDMGELRIAMPEFRDKIPAGKLNASVHLSGEMAAEKPWNDWPLTVAGELAVFIPEYKLAPSKPAAAGAPGTAPAAPAASEPFLAPGFLTANAKLKIAADVASLVKDTLTIRQVSARGTYSDSRFRGDVIINQIFGGSLKAKNLDVPMLVNKPTIQGSVAWEKITIEEALGFAKPEYKSMASGKTAGKAEFATLMPSEPAFLKTLKGRGEILANPVTLNSVKVGEMINEMLAKIPVIKIAPVKMDPLRGQIKTIFELVNETMQISTFEGKDLDGSELQMKGKVLLASMNVDLVGTFFWVQNNLKGCLAEGNSDAKGRLVVPLAIKGDAMKPSFSILTDVAGKIAGRALECEKKKLVERVKKDGVEGIKKELNKTLKGLLGN